MNMNNTVVLDIDGVLADYEEHLVHALYREFGQGALAKRDSYKLEDRFADRKDILSRALQLTADPNFYYGIKPCDGAIQFVEELLDEEHALIYVSSRPQAAYSFTRRWLLKSVTDTDPVLFCGVADKVYFLSRIPDRISFVVEDNPDHIKALRGAGHTVLCWDQPWNEGIFPRLILGTDGSIMLQAKSDMEWTEFFVSEKESA